jgi:TPR repeat protein
MNIEEKIRRAEGGSCVSQCVLGLCYLNGIDVDVNYGEAFRWLSAATNQGSSRATINLAYMLGNPCGRAS